MRFSVLGPLEVARDGNPLPLGGPKQRALLAVLLLRAGEPVARDELAEAVWGDQPPSTAEESLDTYIYRLRKLLGRDRIRREAGGYRLSVRPGERDVDAFEDLVHRARAESDAGEHRAAAATFGDALDLWRGSAWIALPDQPAIAADARRLEELRLVTMEERVEACLAAGDGGELVADLERLVIEHPFRERLVAALMLALYRAGRQTEALDAFHAARQRLLDELALEPGPPLHELQRRILSHDPTLVAVKLRPVPRRLVRVLGAAVLVALAALTAGLAVRSEGDRHRRPSLAPGAGGIVVVNAASDRRLSAAALAGTPGALTADAGSVWAAEPGAEAVSLIAPGSGRAVDRIPLSGEPGSIASGGGAIWVASSVGSTVTRIDPATESVTQSIALPGANPEAVSYGDGRLWVADPVEHELFEINGNTGSLERTVPLDIQPVAISVRGGALWVAGYLDATLEELSASSGRVIGRARVGDGPAALADAAGSVWVANSLDSTVSRVDPGTLRVTATIPVGSGPTALAAGRGAVWVANQYSGTVSRLDPRSDRAVATITSGGAPTSLTLRRGRLWVGVANDHARHRGGTLVLVAPGALTSSSRSAASADPAFYTEANNPQFIGLAYDSLVTFEQTSGGSGVRLVPDLAVAIPMPGDDGRTYAFRIRPGIRYSDGQRLRAGDFRRGVERLFRVQSQGAYLYDGLIGATACRRRPRSCTLARGVVTNDSAGAVTFHFTRPDPEFLFQLTEQGFSAPIPTGRPGGGPEPGTGPYKIAAVNSREVRFVRNPFFHEWSHAAQPAGLPDRIEWRSVPSVAAGVSAVRRGRADWLFGEPPYAEYHRLELRDPAELHVNPQFAVNFLPFNTHAAPFDRLRARQAVNYAIDRGRIVRLYGGPRFALPACQPIVPGIPGYRRYCPYTLHPHAGGAWSAPDLARARRLVARSGTLGDRVNLVSSPEIGFVPRRTTPYLAGVLRALGYRVHVTRIPLAAITQAMWDRMQISDDGNWIPNYPDPSSYIPAFFGCDGGSSNGYYCNPAIDREMGEAERLESTRPTRADRLWERVDDQLTDQAVWVPTVAAREVEVTSRRLHNYEYNPVWGFLADQAWLG